VRLMTALAPHMEKTKFVRWTIKGSQLPLRRGDALRRFSLSPLKRDQAELLMGSVVRFCVTPASLF
jgi:hypothetical protein